ncbi:transketolase N-terminal section [Salmonella enterica subsp. enterica]|nr:transketolase N-terminal section [Salmonella enterica subsp. enterica]
MNVTEITQLARDIRVATLKSLNHLGFGHYGGSMSVVETLAVLYGAVMKIDPADPDWPERDYFVLSKGHAGPALYSTLAIKGYFPREELNTLNQNGTRLPQPSGSAKNARRGRHDRLTGTGHLYCGRNGVVA